ncbi:putative reverse transcriptase domain-containing protein [Tanacetum coccineum]
MIGEELVCLAAARRLEVSGQTWFLLHMDRRSGLVTPVVTDVAEFSQRMTEFETRVRRDTDEVYTRLDDEQTGRQLLAGQLNMLFRDRRAHARTVRLMETEKMTPKRRTTRLNSETTPAATAATTTIVTNAQLQAMIDQGVTAVLAARNANTNGVDNHNSGTGTEGVVELTQWIEKMETMFCISNCSVENQIKFSTCTLLGNALTWWNSHVRTVGNDIAYAMIWTKLKNKMTDKYCPRTEIKKLKVKLWELKVKGTDVIKNWHCCVAIEMAIEAMDKRIHTIADRQTESKRKFEDTSRNTQN